MATKTKATAKKAAPKAGRTKASKAKPEAAKVTKDTPAFELNTFVKFTGYLTDIADDEKAFEPGEEIYLADDDEGGAFIAIKKSDVPTFIESEDVDQCTGGVVSPQELRALSSSAIATLEQQYMPIRMIGDMEELLSANDAITVARDQYQSVQEAYFYMGGALAKIFQEGLHLVENGGEFEGDDAWNDFCQTEFEFKGSKGRDLARIYTTFAALDGFDPATLSDIKWSMAAKAAKYITDDNVDEVLDVVRENTQRTVDEALKTKFMNEDGTTPSGKAAARGAGNRIATTTLTFRLEEAAAEGVSLAINSCMKERGIDSESLAFEVIVMEWAQEHVTGAKAKKDITAKANRVRKERAAREKTAPAPKAEAEPKAAPKAPSKRGRKAA